MRGMGRGGSGWGNQPWSAQVPSNNVNNPNQNQNYFQQQIPNTPQNLMSLNPLRGPTTNRDFSFNQFDNGAIPQGSFSVPQHQRTAQALHQNNPFQSTSIERGLPMQHEVFPSHISTQRENFSRAQPFSQGGNIAANPQHQPRVPYQTIQRQTLPDGQAFQFQSQQSFNQLASGQQHKFVSTQEFSNDSYGTDTNAFQNVHPHNDSENPFVNPNPLPFFEPPQSQKLNPLVQKYQQEFTLKWQAPNKVPSGSRSPPPPPPPVPQNEANPPLPPSDGSGAGKIVTTNILSLMDIINGTKKQPSDSIPGLDPAPDSPKLEIGDTPKRPSSSENTASGPEVVTIRDSPERIPLEISNTMSEHCSKLNRAENEFSYKDGPREEIKQAPGELRDTNSRPNMAELHVELKSQERDNDRIKGASSQEDGRFGGIMKPQIQQNNFSDTRRDLLPIQHNKDFDNKTTPPENHDSVYNYMTLKAFNAKLKEWEKSFEEWKRANANHPDQATYDKYLGQWESWRDKLLQQRKFIVDNIPKAKQNDQGNRPEEPNHWNSQPLDRSIGNNQTNDQSRGGMHVGYSGNATETETRAAGPTNNFFPTSGPLNQFCLKPGIRPAGSQLNQAQASVNAFATRRNYPLNNDNEYPNESNSNMLFNRQNLSTALSFSQPGVEPLPMGNVPVRQGHPIQNYDCFRRNFNELRQDISVPLNPSGSNDEFGFTRRPQLDPNSTILNQQEQEERAATVFSNANINELFTRNRNQAPAVDLAAILEEESLPNAVTIDYGETRKKPEVDPSAFNKDWEAEEYDSYNDRYEEYIRLPPRPRPYYPPEPDPEQAIPQTNFDLLHFRRRPQIPENYPPQQNTFSYSHSATPGEHEMSLPRRDMKPLFPIGDYEMPTRVAPPANGEEPPRMRQAPPANEEELHRLRQAPPRDLEPISPEQSPVTVRHGRGPSLEDDLGRSERNGNKEATRVRSRSRDRVSRRRSRERTRSKDRVRSRDRSYERENNVRDRRNSRSDRRESPARGRRSSPNHGRRSRSTRSRSPDRRSLNVIPRRPSRDCRYGVVIAEDILNMPGRKKRPSQIVIILRGLPGSGKTHVAKLIKDREIEFGESAPRILSLDDYFTEEHDKIEKDLLTGKEIKTKVSKYEYDPALERKYSDDLFKAFRKTVEAGLFRFIIVDCVNDKTRQFEDMANFAKARRFQVYIAEIDCKPEECAKRNVHHRTLEEIKKLEKGWDRTPAHLVKLDVRTLLQEEAIPNAEMEEVSDTEITEDSNTKSKAGDKAAAVGDPDEDEEQGPWAPSKWETSGETLNKLDGLGRKRKKSGSDDENEVPQTKSLDEWLKSHIREDYVCAVDPGKKRVRWKDIEQRREQERSRDIGFVVGQTDWNSITDSDSASAALTQIKYI